MGFATVLLEEAKKSPVQPFVYNLVCNSILTTNERKYHIGITKIYDLYKLAS